MTEQGTVCRRLANWLALRVLTDSAADKRDWALGMAAEIESIEEDGAALRFAFGCWISLCGASVAGRILTPALGVCLFAWAAVKLYFVSILAGSAEGVAHLPGWLAPMILLVGCGYGLVGLCVLLERQGLALLALLMILPVIGGLYWAGLWAGSVSQPFIIALALEDYVIWSFAVFGLLGAFWLHQIEETQV